MRTLKFCSLSKLQLYNTVLPTIVTMLCMSSSDLSYNGKFVAVHQPLPISPTPQALAIPVLLSAFTPLLYFLDSTVCLQPLWGLRWCSCAPPPKWKTGRDQRGLSKLVGGRFKKLQFTTLAFAAAKARSSHLPAKV